MEITWHYGMSVDVYGNVTHYVRDPETGRLLPVEENE